MSHLPRALLTFCSLLAAPPIASAGLIHWGYRAVSPDGTVVVEKTGLTELSWSDYFLPDPLLHGTPIPEPNPGSNLRSDISRSEATVTITDERSGQSGTYWLFTDYVQQYEIRPDGSQLPVYEGQTGGPWPERTNLVLGGNTYSITSPGGEFQVQVTPAPSLATPEPGTLALAVCGLVAAGSWRRRRSMA